MKRLVFTATLSGHHLEYIHHLWMGAVGRSDEQFVFAFPGDEWAKVKEMRTFPDAANITLRPISAAEMSGLKAVNLMQQCWRTSKLIANLARELEVDDILLINLAGVIPVLPFLLPKGVTVSGVIYQIYLYAPKPGLRGWLDKVRYMVMARSRAIRRALVLNAPRAAEELNRLYRTRKFVALADPVPSVDKTKLRDLRTELGISADTQTFLHFGAMGERKGTLDILQAILLLPTSEHKTFIFAGRVGEEIKKEFYNLVGKCRAVGAKILVRDEFCSYELINSLCYTADCLLAPYHLTSLSSGVIGYASVIGTPVIGPADGLIGELIRDNNLGLTISEVTPEQIARAISDFTPTHASSAYAAANTIESFQKTFLE